MSFAAEDRASTDTTQLGANLRGATTEPGWHLNPSRVDLKLAINNSMDEVEHAEGGRAEGAEQSHGGDSPQDELKIEVVANIGTAVSLADGHGKDRVGDHPHSHHVGADGAVIVLLHLSLAEIFLGHVETVTKIPQRFVISRVDVKLLRGHLELDDVALAGHGRPEIGVYDVVAFGAPRDVVCVAEGVNLQGADVAG